MTTSTNSTSSRGDRPPTGLALWWKQTRKTLLPPLFGIGGFLLFWQLSATLGLTKLAGPLSLLCALSFSVSSR